MTYNDECTGSVVIDRQQTSYSGYQPTLWMDEVYAQRFIPSSKCLDHITLRMRRIADIDVVIEIKSDNNGIPQGFPGSGNLGSYQIPYTSIPTSFSNIDIPFGIVLTNLEPKWIVMSSAVYDPNVGTQLDLFTLDGDMISDSTEYTAYSCGTCPDHGKWRTATNRKFYFKTYKQTYAPCVTPSCSFKVA